MRTLIFFRHGKSDWGSVFETDHERPLNKRGIGAAKLMGRFLQLTGQLPDSVLASTAVRALTTAELAHEAGSWKCPIRTTDSLYLAAPADVLGEIREEPASTRTLVVVGHEPTWSETVGLLIGEALVRFPTAAMARIDFEVPDWNEIDTGRGRLAFLVTPRLLEKIFKG